jgi:flagellar M-ring protein FliF
LNALAILGATVLLIWFGLRPALRSILEPSGQTGAVTQAAALASDAPAVALPDGAPQAVPAAALAGVGSLSDGPNLIADLTSKLERTPQKRLEQMVDFDEDQAAAILKQWLREPQNA